MPPSCSVALINPLNCRDLRVMRPVSLQLRLLFIMTFFAVSSPATTLFDYCDFFKVGFLGNNSAIAANFVSGDVYLANGQDQTWSLQKVPDVSVPGIYFAIPVGDGMAYLGTSSNLYFFAGERK